MSYIGNSPGVASQRVVTTFTATANQTTFTPQSGYTLGYIDVYHNGVRLVNGDDYTASNGTNVVLATGAAAGDVVETVAYIPRGLSDGYTKAEADTLLAAKQNSLGYTPVNKAGDTMTGGLYTRSAGNSATFNGSSSVIFGNALRSIPENSRAAMFVGDNLAASCWWVDASSGTQIAVGAVDGINATNGGGLTLWANNAAAWTRGLQVNGGTSAPGSIDLPAQPIMSGQMGTAMTSPSGAQKLAFDQFWVNQGGISYNSGTRRFTVPIAGVYRITMNPFFNTGHSAARVLVGVNTDTPSVNNGHFGHAYRESATYDTGCIDSVVSLAAGDYIVFYLSGGGLYNQSTDRFNQFTIAKIA